VLTAMVIAIIFRKRCVQLERRLLLSSNRDIVSKVKPCQKNRQDMIDHEDIATIVTQTAQFGNGILRTLTQYVHALGGARCHEKSVV
jgi:hypothetical protein